MASSVPSVNNALLCLSMILFFKSSIVSCVYCRYYPSSSIFSSTVWCPGVCCGGYPTATSNACCSTPHGSYYWWISLIVIAVVGVVAGIVGVVICCICCRRRRAFAGRVLYKPPDQPLAPQQASPYVIGASPQTSTPYPTALAYESNANNSDKPPAYDFVVPNSQPATVNVSVSNRN